MSKWLKKIAWHDKAFAVHSGHLYVFDDLHEDWVLDYFGLSEEYASVMRYAFPRGRAVRYDFNVEIEASPGLENYVHDISKALGISMSDRPRWRFDEFYYGVFDKQALVYNLLDVFEKNPNIHQLKKVDLIVPGLSDEVIRQHGEKAV